MLLINNLYGEYDASTSEGRGANAASNLMKYFEEGKKIAGMKAQQLLKGEIDITEACRNEAIEKFSSAYIPYTEINEETGELDLEYGLAFATIYINHLDNDKDGALRPEELGPVGHIVDQIDSNGKITKGKMLAWLIFQDCIDVYNGVITPHEAAKSYMWTSNDSVFVVNKLREIYSKLNLEKKELEFCAPQPIKN